jgi:hypothetical protein
METIRRGGLKMVVNRDRDAGFENETNDCFVHALRHVLGVPYRDAHAFTASQFGRKPRGGTHEPQDVLRAMANDKKTALGYRVFDTDIQPTGTRLVVRRSRRFNMVWSRRVYTFPTLGSRMARFAKGRFLVYSHNHAWAVIDGVVIDNGPLKSNRTSVVGAWEFVPSSQCETEGR